MAEKARLVDAILDRWQAAAQRYGAGAGWRDTFGLQLSMLPGDRLRELALAQPANGLAGIIDSVVQGLRSAAEKSASGVKALGTTTSDLVFIPINPCRIVDTRNVGGAIPSSTPRSFQFAVLSGQNFSGQGGSNTDCGLAFNGPISPAHPKAIAATVTIITPTTGGNLVIYPAGTTPGATSALNYGAGAVLANTTVIVGAQGAAADFTVALNGPAHSADVVVDAIGYYYAPQATALDCVWSGVNTTPLPGGGAGNSAISPSCPAGYSITGGSCYLNDPGGTLLDAGGFNPTTETTWFCFARPGAASASISSSARCCRIPGR